MQYELFVFNTYQSTHAVLVCIGMYSFVLVCIELHYMYVLVCIECVDTNQYKQNSLRQYVHNTNEYRHNTNCLYSIHTNLLTPYWSVLVSIGLYLFVLHPIRCLYWSVLGMYSGANTEPIRKSDYEYKHNTGSIQTVNTNTIQTNTA